MRYLVPLIVFFSIFFTSELLQVLASKKLLEEYSDQRMNVIFNTKGLWSVNKNMFNEKGRRCYITSTSLGILWIAYILDAAEIFQHFHRDWFGQ